MPTEAERLQIVTLKAAEWSWAKIIAFMKDRFGKNISRSTCQYTYRKWLKTGAVSNKPRSGRPPKLNKLEERALKRWSLTDRKKSAQQLSVDMKIATGKSLSKVTVLKILRKYGLRRRLAARRPLLTTRMRKRRMLWGKARKSWTVYDWKRVIFSDEKIFRMFPNRHGVFVTRYKNERYAKDCVLPTQKHSLEVHVWGAIGWRGVAPLKVVNGRLTAQTYVSEIVHDVPEIGTRLKPDVRQFIFEQDGARVHTAAVAMNFFRANDIPVLDWPGNSADLSIIENCWSQVQTKVKTEGVSNKMELLAAVQKAWNSISPLYIRSLYWSMPSRVQAMLKARGGNTRY
jgi:transposase